ncbi:MAG: stage II sporulation protein M [Bacilli bacterium]|nr:stage II sporulation protein M [Bacilli bacterium]MDD3895487.1 stage II sporulation protein M [Bacilli bacterium]MDD4407424.1 stage II sporulation protein M [Bacilli bacterium]
MKLKWTSNNKLLIKFLVSLFILGFLIGIYIYIIQPDITKSSIINELSNLGNTLSNTKQNNFIYHLIIISIFTIFSLFVLGIPVMLFYLFYEGISIGFLIGGFFHYKKIKGLLYGFIFIIINKLIFYFILIYMLIIALRFSKKLYKVIKNKDYKIYELVFLQLLKNGFVFIIVIVFDLLIYLFGNKILAYFLFLL